MRLKPVQDQVVVVFGASSGIGRQAALDFASRGARVVVAARGEAGLQSLVEEISENGGQAFYVVADAANYEQVENVARECVRRYGRMDTWVHAAGVIQFARFEDTTPEEFRQIIEVNLLGQIYGARVALPHLKQRGGALIHLSSVEAIRSAPLQSAYGASKHGISGFLESLRAELIHEEVPVSVTEIMPAVINTPIWETGRNKTGKTIHGPLPPAYHPKVVSDAILFAAENPVRDMVAGAVGLLIRYSERVSPTLADHVTSWVGYRQVGEEPADPYLRDNLFKPVTDSDRVEGTLEGWKSDWDPVTWLRTRSIFSWGAQGGTASTYSEPSNMPRRIAASVVAGIAVVIACYLGSFQAGLISGVWDPIFGSGSEKVLLSWPALLLRSVILIPDAGMGAIAYLGAAVYAIAGPGDRWRTGPWLVLLFGANVMSLGFASTVLVLTQAFVIGEWCFLCLMAACCSYTLVLLASGEVLATLKHMVQVWSGSGTYSALRHAFTGSRENALVHGRTE